MTFRKYFGFVFLWLSVLIAPVAAQDASKHVLDNGLTVIIKPMPGNPMVSVYGLIKAGSATEGKYLGSGLSHFLEHMLFKGTQSRGVGEIGRAIQAAGGSINAQTSYDYTMFTITVPRDAMNTAVELLSDALFHSSLDPVELEKERQVIFGEMRMRKDNPETYLSQLVFRSVYLNHPYKHPIIGYPELFEKVTREGLYDFYKTYYTPNNMVISIAGDVDRSKTLDVVRSFFGSYARSAPIPRNLPPDPWVISPRFVEAFYPTDVTRLAIMFQSVGLMDRDLFALDVLAKILGEGESSRLYRELYQQRELVHEVSAYNYTPYDRGVFGVEATLDDDKREDVERLMMDQIEAMSKKLVTPDELQKAKKQVESEFVMGLQTTEQVAFSQAMDEALTGDHLFAKKYVDGVRAVTAADIQRVARTYLKADVRTTVLLRPQSANQGADAARAIQEQAGIDKYLLSNGITVLLREDHSLPLVSVCLASAGGLRQEPSALNGISSVMSDVWVKGTSSMNAEKIADLVESNGMVLQHFSGRNSMGLKMLFLSSDVDKGLGLLEDLVKNPSFAESEIEKSKEAARVAIRKRQDSVVAYSISALKKLLYPGHPYGTDPEGTMESLEAMTRQDLVDFYQRQVVSRNTVISVFGDINKESVLKGLEKRFGTLKDRMADAPEHPVDPLRNLQELALTMNKSQALVLMGFLGARIDDPDVYGLDVLVSILGSSFSGRLFNDVREKLGQAYTVGGQFNPGIDSGEVLFYVLTTEESVNKVKEIIAQNIVKIQTELVSLQELADTKNYLKGNHKSDQQTNESLGFLTVLDELYGLGFDRYKTYDQNIDAVTAEDIRRLAQKYLDLNQRVIVTTSPTKG